MSIEEIKRLEAEEAELRQKLSALAAARSNLQRQEAEAEARRQEEELLRKPIVIHVARLSGAMLQTQSEYRPDLVEAWKTVPGRTFKGYEWGQDKVGINAVPIANWSDAEQILLNLPFVSIEWNEGVKEEFDWLTNAPAWEIDVVDDKYLTLTPGPNQNYGMVSSMPSVEWAWSGQRNFYKLSTMEAWRIPEALKDVEGVVYSDAASAIVLEQITLRTRLDQIAIQADSDTMRDGLNGFDLRPFQRVFVEFAIATNGRMILADDTGLGKTWEFIAYAEYMRRRNPDFQSIIAVPASALANWRRELLRLTGETPYICLTGKPNAYDAKRIMLEKIPYVLISQDTLGAWKGFVDGVEVSKKEFKPIHKAEPHRTEVVFPWVELFKMADANLLGVDEAHQIKNPRANRTKAVFQLRDIPHLIPMTATPILNRTSELGTLLRLVKPQQFPSQERFEATYTIDGKQARNVDELHKMMRTFFLRRRKQDVYKDMPQINRIHRFYDLSPTAKERYSEVLAGFYTQLAEFDPKGVGGNQMYVMNLLAQITRLTQICAADKARHYTPELATEIADAANGEIGEKKIVIFTHFKGTAAAIARRLGSRAVCTVERTPNDFVSMNADKRDALFESIRERDDIHYLVTTEAAKQNHNLEYCWWTIFNDPWWSPLSHYQAEGRSIRLSAPHSIDSFYVIADTEVEAMKYEILDEKLAIVEEAVEGVEANRDVMGSIGMELLVRLKENMWKREAAE